MQFNKDLALQGCYILLLLGYFVIAMHLPVSIYAGAGHDDGLFISNARHINAGDWLGTYYQMTLAKGPGFPLFLGLNSVFGIPITLSFAILYAFSCWLLATTLRGIGVKDFLVLVIFALVLFHPIIFPIRIVRDNICPALVLIIVSGVIRLVFFDKFKTNFLLQAPLFGIALGLFWITREDSIWIVPGILLLIAMKIVQSLRAGLPIKNIITGLLVFILSAIIFICSIAAVNYFKYGKFAVVEVTGSAFSHVLKNLNSVEAGPEIAMVPVPFAKRQAIYAVSPTFLLLKEYLEGNGKPWTQPGCVMYPHTCGDYAAGWFMWALRDAVASKGLYDNPIDAENFYKRINKEIETACKNGSIKCKANLIPLMPKITYDQIKSIPNKLLYSWQIAALKFPVSQTAGASFGTPESLNDANYLLGFPRAVVNISADTTNEQLFKALKIKSFLSNVYSHIIPVLTVFGLIAYMLCLILSPMRKKPYTDVFFISTCLWVLIFSRIILLVLVDVSSFPAINHQYMLAAFPLVIIAALLSLAAMFNKPAAIANQNTLTIA